MVKWFEELYSWQKAQELAVKIVESFESVKNSVFVESICNCSIDISSEIARWYEKQYDVDFKETLVTAKWVAWKLRSMLHLAKKLNYIKDENFEDMSKLTSEVLWLLWGMLKSFKEKSKKTSK